MFEMLPFYRRPLNVSRAAKRRWEASAGQAGGRDREAGVGYTVSASFRAPRLRVVPDVLTLGTERQAVPRLVLDDDGLRGPAFRALEFGRRPVGKSHGCTITWIAHFFSSVPTCWPAAVAPIVPLRAPVKVYS